jgi:ParB family chromosome partitioning protein
MVHGNKGFGDMLRSTPVSGDAVGIRRPPVAGVLASRENALAALSAGTKVNRVHELIDPARCTIWDGHNRDYAALSQEACSDLIESFQAQGKQEVPAIVRRVKGRADIDFEVICGARRHWTVSWMRTHDYADFKFLVEIRELTDEEAFRVADIENRHRRDISDFERASDYLRAIDRYYDGNQQRMVDRLRVSKSWLSRYLELARLPGEVVSAFGSSQTIGIKHAAQLAPSLKNDKTREAIIAEAMIVSEEQHRLQAGGQSILKPAVVVRRLLSKAKPATRRPEKSKVTEILAPNGRVILKTEKVRGGGFRIDVLSKTGASRVEYLEALEEFFGKLPAEAPLG